MACKLVKRKVIAHLWFDRRSSDSSLSDAGVQGVSRGSPLRSFYLPIPNQIDEVLRALKTLQISDKNKVAIPENWPNNELIGDKVILPPLKDVATAEERLKSAQGYNWWFTYKNLN